MSENKNELRLFNLVEVGIYLTVIEELDVNYWIEQCYHFQKSQGSSELKSNRGGWQSKPNLQHEERFWSLVKTIQNGYSPVLPCPSQIINTLWFNISSFTNWNSPHSHVLYHDVYPYEKYSGVLYLKTPPNSGNIQFKNPVFNELNANLVLSEIFNFS